MMSLQGLFVRGIIVELDVEQIVPHQLDMGMISNIKGFEQLHLEG